MEKSLQERKKVLEKHIKEKHHHSPVAVYLREIVYGGIDGIVTTFAVVAGFTGAASSESTTLQLTFLTVLLFGLANLFADGLSMGLGNFLSVRSDQDVYRAAKAKELKEIKANPKFETEETITILIDKGFSKEDAETLVSIYQKNEPYWLDWMMVHELEMPDPTGDNPVFTGLATFFSFLVFGFIPLIPFIASVSQTPEGAFLYSIGGTAIALIILGLLKWKVTNSGFLRSVLEVVIVGAVAAGAAFLVGTLFQGL